MPILLAAAGAALMAAAPPPPHVSPGHPYHRAQPASAPREMLALIEIPMGSAVKYEIDKVTGHLFVDRFQSMPVVAPANYGSFPSTLAPDGDPLDAVLLARAPVQAGAFVRVRPVGVIRTIDGDDPDDKVLVVPLSAVDPTYDAVRDLKDVAALERERIAAYFRVYKQLPDGQEGKIVESAGLEAALAVIREAMARYEKDAPRR